MNRAKVVYVLNGSTTIGTHATLYDAMILDSLLLLCSFVLSLVLNDSGYDSILYDPICFSSLSCYFLIFCPASIFLSLISLPRSFCLFVSFILFFDLFVALLIPSSYLLLVNWH